MKENIYKHRILILNFGSQYAQLVARCVRKLGVFCELWTWDITEAKIRDFNPSGIILSGGPDSTTRNNSPRAPQYVFEADIPVLGICYGMQTMVIQLGGNVETSNKREFGYAQVIIKIDSELTHGIEDSSTSDGRSLLDVWMSHVDRITALPCNFINLASTEICPFAIITNKERRFYGVQFHPEVTHTRQGVRILERFIFNICKCKPVWTSIGIIDGIINRICKQIGNDRVILGLSGGIDSSVTAILLHRAIGKNLICVFVDNGLLRLNEAKQVMDMFSKHFDLNIIYISAEDLFLKALKGKKDPETKRKIIGNMFIKVFYREALKQGNVKWLAQGTIYSDVIESATLSNGNVNVIKSHHNVGGLPEKMKIEIIEPLKELFKDEVRQIGIELGLPNDLLYRHPFPGPGLGIRILGEVKKEYCDLLRQADAIFIEELKKADLHNKVSQAFAVFLPVRSVGVMGDNRKYDWVISLRAVETIDFMTVCWVNLPHNFLIRVSNRIINEVNGISRVVYDISSKPPATIEWE